MSGFQDLKLEDFSLSARAIAAPGEAAFSGDLEAIKLETYETGYRSGWDDASAAREGSETHIAADLERNLKSLSVTYEEARAEVLRGIAPLLQAITSGLLPAIVAEAIVPVVEAELDNILPGLGEASCEIIAAPQSCSRLEKLAEKHMQAEINFRSEPAFAEGQVSLRFATEQREVDLGSAIERIASAIREFSEGQTTQEENPNG